MEKEITKHIYLKDFTKTYIEDICGVLGLHSKLEKSLIELIWDSHTDGIHKDLDINDLENLNAQKILDANHMLMTRNSKQGWANKLSVSLSSINNTLTKLIAKKAILKVEGATFTYQLNRDYFNTVAIDINNTSFKINYKFIKENESI